MTAETCSYDRGGEMIRSWVCAIGVAALLPAVSGCTVIGFQRDECRTDNDCAGLGTGAVCASDGYCETSGGGGFDQLQAGLLYIGPVTDHGWTKAHDDGRLYMLEQIPEMEARFAPAVSPVDAPDRIDEFVARGDNIIFGTSFDFLVPMQAAALRYPDVNFLLCSGFQQGPNLGSYFGRMYQVMYQAGILAGRMTTENKIGLVGPVIIPETVRHVNAFTLGVQSVNPAAEVRVRWVRDWFHPENEAAAANELLDGGVDVLFGHTDTAIPIETAEARESEFAYDLHTIGYDNPDSCTFAPNTCMTSAYWNWGPLMTRLVREMREGTWDPTELPWEQLQPDPQDSTAYLAPISTSVPSAIRIEVEQLVQELSEPTEDGLYLPFRGPIRDQSNALRVSEGEYPSDDDLLKMCWFVNGVRDVAGAIAEVPMDCVGER